MDQKAILVGRRYTAVGNANLDGRSMRLTFKIAAINTSGTFVAGVNTMLTEDIKQPHLINRRDHRDRSLAFRITCRAIRLAALLL
jgi:cardiolipin synthase